MGILEFSIFETFKSEWKSEVGSTADDGETSVSSDSAQNAPTWWVERTTVSRHAANGVSQFDSAFGRSLWSPQVDRRNARIYEAMKNVKPQDVILHINQDNQINLIIGISRAKASYGEFIIPKGTQWTEDGERPGFYVPLTDYVQLTTPIKWQDLRSVKEKELRQIYSMERNLFYDRNLDFNQGKYLTRAPQKLVTTINDYYRSKTGNNLPWYSSAGTTSFSDPLMARIRDALESSYQVILFGPPGTGKTYAARKFVANVSDSRKVFITFHPSYSYEEFIEGIRPRITDSGQIVFEVRDGKFKALCIDAMNTLLKSAGIKKTWEKSLPELDQEEKARILAEASKEENWYYLIIDEINRGDISKIFGELITLVEADKRLTKENEMVVPLAYSDKTIRFGVPPNLYIIGTMNTADRSIALIDVALRRRFRFVELLPDYGTLSRELQSLPSEISSLAVNSLKGLNERLRLHYDRDHQIGHGYFIKLKNLTKHDAALRGLKQIWFYEIIPLLQEYFYNNGMKLFEILNKDERLFEVPPDSNNHTFVLKDADSISDSDFLEFLKGIR